MTTPLVRCDGCRAAKDAGWEAWITHVWYHVQDAKRRVLKPKEPT